MVFEIRLKETGDFLPATNVRQKQFFVAGKNSLVTRLELCQIIGQSFKHYTGVYN